MTIPDNPERPDSPDQHVPVSEVPDPVETTAPRAEPAPDERDDDEAETTAPAIGVPGVGAGTSTPVAPVPPVPNLGSGH